MILIRILSHKLQHEIRNPAGLVKNWGDNTAKNWTLCRSLTQKYPPLRKYFDEKIV